MDNTEFYSTGAEGSFVDRDQMKLKVLDLSDLMPTQSVSLAIQDSVDTIKNRATVNTTVMGSAYAKWLSNPVMGTDYQQVIETATAETSTNNWMQLAETIEILHILKGAQHYSGPDNGS